MNSELPIKWSNIKRTVMSAGIHPGVLEDFRTYVVIPSYMNHVFS